MTRHEYDVCVVGSGASGALAALRLVAAGLRVVMVEQGGHVGPGVNLNDLVADFESARARELDGSWSEAGYPWTACAVGGGTRFYAGVSLRMRAVDFAADAYAAPDALPCAWPFTADDLRSDYESVERLIGVSRTVGDPTLPGGTVTGFPEQPYTGTGRLIADAASRLGLRPFPMPLAVNTIPFAGAPACADLTACTDHVCPTGAKGDVYQRVLSGLVGGGLRLYDRCKVVRLVETAPGRVGAAECVDLTTGAPLTIRAERFVVGANAIQTAALLLRSVSAWSPGGLGNGSGLVGRGLCMKGSRTVRGALDGPPGHPAPRRYSTVAVTDHYLDERCPTGLGGLILETADVEDDRGLRVECLVADQPTARNRVTLDWSVRDRLGLPRLVIDYRPHPVDLRRLDYVAARAEEILVEAGVTKVVEEPMDFHRGSGHLHGTCRMGADPGSSVCDEWGRLHGVRNVWIVDGSLMPYPGGVNPTLTIQALANRVARHMVA